jgi:hypothetical protein
MFIFEQACAAADIHPPGVTGDLVEWNPRLCFVCVES